MAVQVYNRGLHKAFASQGVASSRTKLLDLQLDQVAARSSHSKLRLEDKINLNLGACGKISRRGDIVGPLQVDLDVDGTSLRSHGSTLSARNKFFD